MKVYISVVMANSLDSELICEILGKNLAVPGIVIDAARDYYDGITACKNSHPDLLVIDPKCARDAIAEVVELCRSNLSKAILIMDDCFRPVVLSEILPYQAISYWTRQTSCCELLHGIRGILLQHRRAFDPAVQGQLQLVNNRWRMVPASSGPCITRLTPTEKIVLRWLASGLMVREIAQVMRVSESTVDNHKTRLMKKLGIHKVTGLVHFAIKSGFVHVA